MAKENNEKIAATILQSALRKREYANLLLAEAEEDIVKAKVILEAPDH